MRRRIIAGIGAGSFGMAINTGIQFVSLPLFLHYWDTSTYGVWLMLSAIPAYLSMADVGMVTAAGNRMTMAQGKGDPAEANRVFQSTSVLIVSICASLAVLIVPLILWVPLHWLRSVDQRLALSFLCLNVLITLISGLPESIFRSTQRYAFGTLLGNSARLAEWCGSMLGLALVGSFAAVALGGLVVRTMSLVTGIMLTRTHNNGIEWGVKHANRHEIIAMIKPALSFMAFPLANALSFQSLTLLVGNVFGPSTVAIFNTYRTIARVSVQITAIFSHSLWPEFSRLFAANYPQAINKLFRQANLLGGAQAVLLSVVLYFTSPWLIRVWTHAAIPFVPVLMLLMLLYASVGGLWHISRILLMATNQHSGLAYWALATGAVSIILAWALSHMLGVSGVVVAMLLSESLIAIICFNLAQATLAQRRSVAT